jgi:hypothetical protein
MPDAYTPNDDAGRVARIEQVTRRLDTDVQRLLQNQKTPGETPNSSGGGGSPDGGGLARFQLVAKLYRGQTSLGAIRLDIPGTTASIKCDYGNGYWFGDEKIFASKVGSDWQVVGSGKAGIGNQSNTAAPIAKGSSASRALSNGWTVTLKANCGAIGASKKYDAIWDEINLLWVAVAAEC